MQFTTNRLLTKPLVCVCVCINECYIIFLLLELHIKQLITIHTHYIFCKYIVYSYVQFSYIIFYTNFFYCFIYVFGVYNPNPLSVFLRLPLVFQL